MNEVQTVTKNVRLHQWAAIIQDCRSSGLKVDDYCQENNISRNAYYYWLRKIKEEAIEASGITFAEITPAITRLSSDYSQAAPVTISLGDAVININDGSSEHLLNLLMKAVKNA